MNIYLLNKIDDNYTHSSRTFQAIADVILDFKGDKFNYTVKELSQKAYCAQSTILKYIKTLGFDSYSIFKHELNNNNYEEYNLLIKSYSFAKEAYNKVEVKNKLLKDIDNCKYVLVYASGNSRIPAYNFHLKVSKIDHNKFNFNPDISKYDLKECIIIFISNSGMTKKWINLTQQINCPKTYLITNRSSSMLAKNVSCPISLNNTIESNHIFDEFPTESIYSLCYFMDLLFKDLYENVLK